MLQENKVQQGSEVHPNEFNLIWVDMEMTGLNPDADKIIEIAIVVTDAQLNVLAQAPVLAIHQPDDILNSMDAWNQGTHSRSGLIDRVKASNISEEDAQEQMINFLRPYVPKGKSPMCGNTICQDRRFMARGMPKLESYFHYRNVDVSTIKELCRRWKPEIVNGFKKRQEHSALSDILESIEELKYYRQHFISL